MIYTLLNTLDAWSEANPGTLLVLGLTLGAVIIASLAIWVEMGERKEKK